MKKYTIDELTKTLNLDEWGKEYLQRAPEAYREHCDQEETAKTVAVICENINKWAQADPAFAAEEAEWTTFERWLFIVREALVIGNTEGFMHCVDTVKDVLQAIKEDNETTE